MIPSSHCRAFPWRSSVAASILVVTAVQVLASGASDDFQPYFSGLAPAVAATIICVAGFLALAFLQQRFGLCVVAARFRFSGLGVAALATVPFVVAVTLADLLLGFPLDIKVGLPAALVFYPVMGLLAQLALHIVPFAVALSILSWVVRAWSFERRLWLAMILSASVEATFQVVASSAGNELSALGAFVAALLFAFGVAELFLYRRFDFVTMYVFRLVYYGYWHVLWGNLLRPAS